jgi:hypothetical protein
LLGPGLKRCVEFGALGFGHLCVGRFEQGPQRHKLGAAVGARSEMSLDVLGARRVKFAASEFKKQLGPPFMFAGLCHRSIVT